MYYKVITFLSYLRNKSKRELIKYSLDLKSKDGLEIGGPSSFFGVKSYFPVYLVARSIDGVNFSTETVWEGALKEGQNYKYFDDKTGFQFIAEASDLSKTKSECYDFLLSCHSLEHVANAIKALKEWNRVLKKGGNLVLVLPDKNFTFDHARPYTAYDHLIDDYKSDVNENDSTHFSEIMSLHDMEMDTGVNSKEELLVRTNDNFINRCVHHHVFSMEVIKKMLEYSGFSVYYQQACKPFHLVTLAKKKD